MEDLKAHIECKFVYVIDKQKMMAAIRSIGGDNYAGTDDYGERRKRNCWWVEAQAKRMRLAHRLAREAGAKVR
jgi:hypothetical protein